MNELVLTARGVALPAAAGIRRSRSVDPVALHRDRAGRVRRSTRLAGGAELEPALKEAVYLLDRCLDRAVASAARIPYAVPQSALATVRYRTGGSIPAWHRTWAVARVETAVGPLLTGWAGPASGDELTATPVLPAAPMAPPDSWQDLPVLLAAPVAGLVAAAARMVLTSRAGLDLRRRSAGRAVLPGLSLLDVPVCHPPGAVDDAGQPTEPAGLVDRGRLTAPPADSGDRVWDHDAGGCGPAPVHRVELRAAARIPAPDRYLELTQMVERVQRYQAGGTVALTCLARDTAWPGRQFLVELRGRPLTLLRHATAGPGPAVATFSEDEAQAPVLVLPSAAELARPADGGGGIRAV